MGQILVRNLDDSIIVRLKARAQQNDTSLEQTVREILTQATRPSRKEWLAEIDAIRAKSKYAPPGQDSTAFLRAWRDGDFDH